MSFKDKVVVITGSSAGIGANTAVTFAKEGAFTVIVGRNSEGLNKVAEECSKHGPKPLVVKTDISEESNAEMLINKTVEQFGKIDVLVNNAGIVRAGSVLDGNLLSSYDEIMKTNVRPVLHLTTLCVPHLIKTKGNIINVSSVAALVTNSVLATYGLSKAALDHFTKTTAQILAPKGIRVNSINPGPVKTDILKTSGLGDDTLWEKYADMTGLQRVSDPQEISDMIFYIAGEKAKGITGSIIVIDNGWLVRG